MNKELFKYICCPSCKKELSTKRKKLYCNACNITYEIKNNVPVLINPAELTEHLQHQIEYFTDEDKSRPTYKLAAWQQTYLRRFYENIDFKKNMIVVDVASGSGYMAIELARKGAVVFASDLTLSELYKLQPAIKKYHLENNLFLVCCSAEALPFKDKIADIVTENAILEHLYKEKEAVEEINRICKRKASVMISVPISYKYIWPFLIPVNYFHDKRIGHLRRYSVNRLKKLFPKWDLKEPYYSGHLAKFIFFALGVLLKTDKFDKISEKIDKRNERNLYGSSVLTCFFTRNA